MENFAENLNLGQTRPTPLEWPLLVKRHYPVVCVHCPVSNLLVSDHASWFGHPGFFFLSIVCPLIFWYGPLTDNL